MRLVSHFIEISEYIEYILNAEMSSLASKTISATTAGQVKTATFGLSGERQAVHLASAERDSNRKRESFLRPLDGTDSDLLGFAALERFAATEDKIESMS